MTTKNLNLNFLVEAFDENNELQNILIAERIGHLRILEIYFKKPIFHKTKAYKLN